MTRFTGAALITAIMVTALAALLATALMVHQRLLIAETGLISNTFKGNAALGAVTVWASTVLSQKNHQVLHRYPETTINGATVSGVLLSRQGKFNLNRLHSKKAVPAFVVLMRAVDPDLSAGAAEKMAEAVYLVAREETFLVPSELVAIPGMHYAVLLRLLPMVTALPKEAEIDINAVSAPVLVSLFKLGSATMSQAEAFIACRKARQGFQAVADVNRCLAQAKLSQAAMKHAQVVLKSDYYTLVAKARIGDQHLTMATYFKKGRVQWQAMR